VSDFAKACELIAGAGFTIEEAYYQGRRFGSWTIEISSEGSKPRLILWDGRDRWIILQTQRAAEWIDEWVIREAQSDAIEQVIARLTHERLGLI